MANLNVNSELGQTTHLHWGAVWAGVFTFFAIWSVFGALCLAIFANSANMGLAISVWGIVLTIIAMFFAGRTTGHVGGITKSEGVVPAIVMFGLAVASILFIVVLCGAAFGGTSGSGLAHTSLLGLFSHFGWALFVGLILGWLAAISGAYTAHNVLLHPAMQQEVRNA